MRSALVVVVLSASVVKADIATWLWTVTDTGNGDGLIEPGEAAELTLWMGFAPEAVGFAVAGPYAITGDTRWASGSVESHGTRFDPDGIYGDGSLDPATNTISGIQHLQFPPVGGQRFYPGNPLTMYSILWRPASYDPAIVMIDNGAPDAFIYIDDWGRGTMYTGTGGLGEIVIVPGPPTAVLAGAALGVAWRRRRRGRYSCGL